MLLNNPLINNTTDQHTTHKIDSDQPLPPFVLVINLFGDYIFFLEDFEDYIYISRVRVSQIL